MLYLLTLLVRINWDRIDTVPVVLTVVVDGLFLLGLLLNVFRERLLAMPTRIQRREGLSRVPDWR